MKESTLRVLLGVVGTYAVARGVGLMSEFLQVVIVVFGQVMDLGWVNTLAATGAVLLAAAGLFLLLAPPKPLLNRLLKARSVHEGMVGIVGTFLIVLGIEQVYVFSATLGRWVSFFYSSGWDMAVFAVALAVPPGLVLCGWRMTRPQEPAETSEAAGGFSVEEMWSVGAMAVGAFVLSLALPGLSQLVAFIRLNSVISPPSYFMAVVSTQAISTGLEIGFAVFLLLGAPRLVRWHLARVQAQSQVPGETGG